MRNVTRKSVLWAAMIAVIMLCSMPAAAAQMQGSGRDDVLADPVASHLDFGPEWVKVTDGVWEKVDDGIVERRVFGLSGLQWKLDRERETLVDLLDEYAVVRPGMENRAEALLAKIRRLEEIETSMQAQPKVTVDQDSGTNSRCESTWSVYANCTFALAYSLGSYVTASFTDPMCSATAEAYSFVQSDVLPAGESDYDVYSVGPTGAGGSTLACARLYCGPLGCDYDQWYHVEGEAQVVYGTFINYGFYTVECEYDWAL